MFFEYLRQLWAGVEHPFLRTASGNELQFHEIDAVVVNGIDNVKSGDVVALIGDFDVQSIATFIHLLALGAIVVPLTKETRGQHDYFIGESFAQYVFEKENITSILSRSQKQHPLLDLLRSKKHPGLVLFTTGTTGRPKAILHDLIPFISRFQTPRPPLRAISFLLFDHIGGINTLLHMLFNLGQIISIKERTVEEVANTIKDFSVELLPTTPTFLRMLSLYPDIRERLGNSLQIISYGTERMDQPTLQRLCDQFPEVDFRQTYGMSELGILRVRSKSRDSLFMKVGGEGVKTKIVDSVLYIKADNRMIGYLNAPSPFDEEGWYCTKDIVVADGDGFLKIVGRDSDIINVGGLKFMPSEIERESLKIIGVKFAKASGVSNPITGQYLELRIEPEDNEIDHSALKQNVIKTLKSVLPRHMVPSRVIISTQKLSHRFKRL
jgi:long-chain acyl-CoA synthetase